MLNPQEGQTSFSGEGFSSSSMELWQLGQRIVPISVEKRRSADGAAATE